MKRLCNRDQRPWS